MFCKNCGKEINDNAVVCPNCGCATGSKAVSNDTGNIGWGFLGFFFPLIGLILYLVWKDDKPLSAHVAGKGALISVIISVVVSILSIIFAASCASCLIAGTY